MQVSSKHIITKLYFDIGGEAEGELSADPESLQVSKSQQDIQDFFFSLVHRSSLQWTELSELSGFVIQFLCACPPHLERTWPDKGTFKH